MENNILKYYDCSSTIFMSSFFLLNLSKTQQLPHAATTLSFSFKQVRILRRQTIDLYFLVIISFIDSDRDENISWRSKKAGRFDKLLGFARSHSIVTRG